jgi:hypothetical protein
MDSLYQRLKELDSDTFQRLCFHILKERHPGLEVRHVEGASGDKGLDVFAGDLSGRPAVWQCKAFSNGVRRSQRAQIKQSLDTALTHYTPSYWILCLSVGLDVTSHRWFQNLKESYAPKVKVELLTSAEIVHELMYKRKIRNQFFQGAVFDLTELKRIATRTGELSLEELERITDANLEDIIERWQERDARFNYQIVFDGDLGPPESQAAMPENLVMSISTGAKKINVFARDVASLRSNPPTFSIQFKGTGVEKMMSVLNTGVGQEFNPDELGTMSTDWDLLRSATNFTGNQKLTVTPSAALTNRTRSVRVLFRQSDQIVQYGLMELRPVRMGRKEAEFSISGKHAPFTMSFVTSVPPLGNVKAVIQYDGAGREIREIKKSMDALSLLRPSGEIQIIDLETEKTLFGMTAELPVEWPQRAEAQKVVNELVAIADRFRATLILPDKLVRTDYQAIALLKRYMDNGTEEVNDISIVLTKSEENKDSLPELFASGKGLFRFTHERLNPPPKLFGTLIDTGPVLEEAEAEIKDLATTLKSFREAAIGSGVKMSFRPLNPVRFLLFPEGEDLGPKLGPIGGPFSAQNGS